jgi:hypothetical protein
MKSKISRKAAKVRDSQKITSRRRQGYVGQEDTKTDFLNKKVAKEAKVKGLSATQEPYDESWEARLAALALLPQISRENL